MADSSELEYDEEQSGEQAESRPAGEPRPATGSAEGLPIEEGAVFGVVGVVVTYLSHLYLTMVAAGQAVPSADTELVSAWIAVGWPSTGRSPRSRTGKRPAVRPRNRRIGSETGRHLSFLAVLPR